MQIQLNTGSGVAGKATLEEWASEHLRQQLHRFVEHVSRIDIQLSDVSGGRAYADDKRCTLGAKRIGASALVVQDNRAAVHQALRGAVDKLVRVLGSHVDRRTAHRDRASIGTLAEDSAEVGRGGANDFARAARKVRLAASIQSGTANFPRKSAAAAALGAGQ